MFEALGNEGRPRAAGLDGYKTCLPHKLLHCLQVSGTRIRKDVNDSEYLAALSVGSYWCAWLHTQGQTHARSQVAWTLRQAEIQSTRISQYGYYKHTKKIFQTKSPRQLLSAFKLSTTTPHMMRRGFLWGLIVLLMNIVRIVRATLGRRYAVQKWEYLIVSSAYDKGNAKAKRVNGQELQNWNC